MPARSFRAGVSAVSLSAIDPATTLPSCSALTFTACPTTLTDVFLNSKNSPLDTTATYQVIVGLVGMDQVNKGYTIGVCSPSSGALAVTSTQGILVNVLNANWGANFGSAVCAAVFLKKNSGSFQLADFAYIDPSNAFNHMIVGEPLITQPLFTNTLLQSNTTDATLGSRAPYGVTYTNIAPTTGGVNITRQVDTVTFSPDNSANFPVATTRSTEITFQLLANDIKDVVRASAGNYSAYTSSGHTLEEAQMSMMDSSVLVTGNLPLKLVMPLNKFGKQEVRLYLGSISQNQTQWAEAWKKDAQTPVSFTFSTVSLDTLILGMHCEVIYRLDS